MTTRAELDISLEPLVEAVARRTAELVLARLDRNEHPSSPWLSGAKAAAEYLGWPTERVYKALPRIPHYRDGNRLMFRRYELDRFVESEREGPRPP
jgi:hypothetical protein